MKAVDQKNKNIRIKIQLNKPNIKKINIPIISFNNGNLKNNMENLIFPNNMKEMRYKKGHILEKTIRNFNKNSNFYPISKDTQLLMNRKMEKNDFKFSPINSMNNFSLDSFKGRIFKEEIRDSNEKIKQNRIEINKSIIKLSRNICFRKNSFQQRPILYLSMKDSDPVRKKSDNKIIIPVVGSSKKFKDVIDMNQYLIRSHPYTEINPLMQSKNNDMIRENFYSKNYPDKYTLESTESQSDSSELSEILGPRVKQSLKNNFYSNPFFVSDMITHLSNSEYENFKIKEIGGINQNNLSRVIHVRNKIKNNISIGERIRDINYFKSEKKKIEKEIIDKKISIGNPSFIKTKFKPSTLKKIKTYF